MAGAPTGGAELFFERLSIALARAGDDVLPVIRRNPDRAARLRANSLTPLELPFGGPLDLFTRPRLATALRRFQPRVTVAWMGRAAAATPRGDWVLTGRLGGTYDLRRFRHCDHLVANTRGLATWITAQGWPAHRTHYLPNFAPDLKTERTPSSPPLVLALGRLHPNKGFDVLIRAVAPLSNVRLLIAGEGPERASLTGLGRDLLGDRLLLPGWQHDTASLLAKAHLLVCPSRIEPLGNVVIEAWSAGRPVVAAASAGPSELITPGLDGLLVPPDDPDALRDAILSVLDDPARAGALASAGRARYETDFAETPVLASWRAFLESVEKA